MHIRNDQSGLTLLVTLLLMSVLLGISSTLLNVTIKQYQLAGIARSSEMAFQAANAGIECMQYLDLTPTVSPFTVNGDGTTVLEETLVACMDDTSADIGDTINNTVASGEEQRFEFDWGSPAVCTDVSIYKFKEDISLDGNATGPDMSSVLNMAPDTRVCPEGTECTIIRSRGYNTPCDSRNNPRTVERELTQVY